MYLKDKDNIKVISRLNHLLEIEKESERITKDEWIASAIGAACMIGILFLLSNLINQ